MRNCYRSSYAHVVYSQSAYSIIHNMLQCGSMVHFPYLGNHVYGHFYSEDF